MLLTQTQTHTMDLFKVLFSIMIQDFRFSDCLAQVLEFASRNIRKLQACLEKNSKMSDKHLEISTNFNKYKKLSKYF